MQEEQIIPKQLKKYKGTLFLNLTWVDLGIILSSFILSIIIWATLPINYWAMFILAFLLILTSVLSTIPINKTKPYTLLYRKIVHLTSKQKYSKAESKDMLNPYYEIKDGFTYLKTGSAVKIIELTGFNLFILQKQEQLNRISAFRSFILANPEVTLFKSNMSTSLKNQRAVLTKALRRNKDENIKEIIRMNQRILDQLEKDNHTSIDKYFLLITGKSSELNERYKSSMRFLKQMYLAPREVDSEVEILEVLKTFYLTPATNLNDLANCEIDFKTNHIVVNKKEYMRIYAVHELPSTATIGWLNTLSISDKISWQIAINTYDKVKATKKIDKVIKSLEEKKLGAKKASQEVQANTYIESMYELQNLIHADGESINSIKILLIAREHSFEGLTKLDKIIKQELTPKNIWLDNLKNLQREAFNLMIPTSSSKSNLPSVELPSLSLALGMPFYAERHKDKDGTYLGYSDYGASIFFDPTLKDSYRKNSNIVIMGTSGSGKSTVTKKLMKDMFIRGNKIIAIDPEREYKKLCKTLNGEWINFGTDKAARSLKINPLQFMKNEGRDRNLMATHLQFLEQFFKTLFPELNQLELNILRKNLIATYNKKGIDEKSHLKNIKKFPIITDVIKMLKFELKNLPECKEKEIVKDLIIYFSVFTGGSPEGVLWNGKTNVDLKKSDFIVMDIHSLNHSGNKRLSNAQMFLLLKLTNNEMVQNKVVKERGGKDKFFMCVIDEAHLLVDEKYPVGLNFMYEFIKRARKYNSLGMIATQNVRDFIGGSEEVKKKTSAIINTSQYSFFLEMKSGDVSDLDEVYRSSGGLTELEKDTLMSAGAGRCIFALSTVDRKIIQIDIPQEELELWEERKK